MNGRGNELGAVADLIAERVRFLKAYQGEVLEVGDPEARGRVRCSVPELGWFTGSESPWCDPRYSGGGLVVPQVGTYVEVGFMGGDPSRPYYRGALGEASGQAPAPYAGPASRVLYSDGERQVTYDSDADELRVDGFGTVAINGKSKSFVTYAELKAALDLFLASLTAAMTTTPIIGNGSPQAIWTGLPTSIDISAAETETVKTGG